MPAFRKAGISSSACIYPNAVLRVYFSLFVCLFLCFHECMLRKPLVGWWGKNLRRPFRRNRYTSGSLLPPALWNLSLLTLILRRFKFLEPPPLIHLQNLSQLNHLKWAFLLLVMKRRSFHLSSSAAAIKRLDKKKYQITERFRNQLLFGLRFPLLRCLRSPACSTSGNGNSKQTRRRPISCSCQHLVTGPR